MILYSVIARSNDGAVLAEATAPGVEGNHPQVTQQLLQALVGNASLVAIGNRKTFAHAAENTNNDYFQDGGDYDDKGSSWGKKRKGRNADDGSNMLETYFHVQRGESIYFICLSDDRDSKKQRGNFGFLFYVQKEFTQRYTPNKIEKANAYAFDKPFRKTYSNLMHHCNTTTNLQSDPQINRLNAEIESIKNTMDINLDLLTRREMRMEHLLEASDDLLEDSQVFNKRSTALKRVMKKKSFYYKLILVGFALFTIYLMMVKLCGFKLSCQASNNGYNNANNGHGNGYYGNNNNQYNGNNNQYNNGNWNDDHNGDGGN